MFKKFKICVQLVHAVSDQGFEYALLWTGTIRRTGVCAPKSSELSSGFTDV